jgi:4-hydroxybenzoate polyprenyltransferase
VGFFGGWHDLELNVFPWRTLIVVVLCMVFARNAAMGFNRYIDRKYDEKNSRTKNREIPSGVITPEAALTFVIVNCVSFCATTLCINRLTFYLSFVALAVVLGYSYTKRFTALCHFVLGLGLSIAPTGAYIALTGEFAVAPTLLSLFVLFWVGGFDIIYALLDENFDRENGLHSVPARLGRRKAMLLSAAAHLATVAIAIYLGLAYGRGVFYWTGCAVFILLLVYQHVIVAPESFEQINATFSSVNGSASVCYALFTVIDLLQ